MSKKEKSLVWAEALYNSMYHWSEEREDKLLSSVYKHGKRDGAILLLKIEAAITALFLLLSLLLR